MDYYDSDEDNFLDRTGVVEKKRQKRMKVAGKLESQTETHHALVNYKYILYRYNKILLIFIFFLLFLSSMTT